MKRAVEIIFFASTKKSVSTPVLLVVTLPDKAGRLATDVRAPAFASVGVRSVGVGFGRPRRSFPARGDQVNYYSIRALRLRWTIMSCTDAMVILSKLVSVAFV